MKIENGMLVKRKDRTWVGVYDHPHVLWISGTHKGEKTVEYDDLLMPMENIELVNYQGYGSIQFNIKVTMESRWVPHFLSMLKYMEQLGGLGSSRNVTLYSDGDGDFRPQFEFDETLLPYRALHKSDDNGHRTFDAG